MKSGQGITVILTVFTILVVAGAGCVSGQAPAPATNAGPSPVPMLTVDAGSAPAAVAVQDNQSATREEMVAFVKEAVAFARENGKEKALSEFSNRNGSFFRGMLYIYAYDYNGTTIAHPVNPEKIGINRLFEPDAEGTFFITNLRQAAYNGTGFSTYTYINPAHNNAVERKLGYVEKVDESWWLGSGIYLGQVMPAPANQTTVVS